MESIMKDEVGESSSNSRLSNDNNGDNKAVVVRVKRKLDQSPLEAFWLEINEIPVKRPLIDFQKLSISDSSTQEELKIKRVLVEHVETVSSAKASIHFLQSFVPPTPDGDSKFKASTKERRRTLQKENKHDQLLSKAKQEQEEIARGARFEQIWKHRTHNKKAIHDEALNEVCRVYDVLRVDKAEETSKMINKQEEMSVEEQEILSKFLPLLRECVPGAAEEIESDIVSSASRHDSAEEYVYDLYTVKEQIDETEASYPFPLVQVDDDDDHYDGPDYSDYETDDSNAEDHPANDYPEEESSDEEKSSKSGSDSEEESEAESDMSEKSEDSIGFDQAEDPLYEDEMNESHDNADSYDDGDDEDWR
ncbi:RNA-directed DNA methylation 4-like [Chenopodium quinoa]|uniref:RNA-directed DNA methylation 4-like n=1 Tax=Chenopodium quinoa TaxID=63459 RepID=UPI000B78A92B|nr:RNA-directed DNA methylation 4-like [Chenopodium quinoa]